MFYWNIYFIETNGTIIQLNSTLIGPRCYKSSGLTQNTQGIIQVVSWANTSFHSRQQVTQHVQVSVKTLDVCNHALIKGLCMTLHVCNDALVEGLYMTSGVRWQKHKFNMRVLSWDGKMHCRGQVRCGVLVWIAYGSTCLTTLWKPLMSSMLWYSMCRYTSAYVFYLSCTVGSHTSQW